MNAQVSRLLAAAAVAAVAVSIVALVVVILLRGGVEPTAPSITGLISFVGLLVGLMVALLQGQTTQHLVVDLTQKLNGHLDDHKALAAQASAPSTQEKSPS